MGNKSFDKVEKNLKERGYQVRCFDTAQEAARYLDEQIDGRTVGAGIRDNGSDRNLSDAGKTQYSVLASADAAGHD